MPVVSEPLPHMLASTQKISPSSFQSDEGVPGVCHPAAAVEARLGELVAVLSSTTLLPTDDFATQLQFASWQNERRELETMLREIKRAETAELRHGTSH